MKTKLAPLIPCLFALLVITGCASVKVTDLQQLVIGPIPRPGNVLVYDFAATAAEVPRESALAGHAAALSAPQTPKQIATGRYVGAQIAGDLVGRIHLMGMPAERAFAGTPVQLNDIVIRGYLISINEGSTLKRVTIGFGYGASEVKAAMEGYQMTRQGLHKIESETLDSNGAKMPGSEVGVAALLVTGNPVGLIVSSGIKVYGETSGSFKIQGRADKIAKEIADQLQIRFQEQGWIK